MRVTLEVTDGPHKGKTFTFQGHDTFLVGRSRRTHLRLPAKDMYFSRVHFLVEVNPPQCRLMDMGSRNGTHVNGQRVDVVDLADGDQIKAGHTVFRLTIDAAGPPSVAVPVAAATTPAGSGSQSMIPTVEQAPAPPPVEATHQPPAVSLATQEYAPPGEGVPANEFPPSIAPEPLPAAPAPPPPPAPPPELTLEAARTIPAATRRPAVATAPCDVCGAPRPEVPATMPGAEAHALDGRLCAECLRRMQSQTQIVPGYRLLKELGRGGMGVVHLAARDADGQLVALKTIIPAVDAGGPEVQKFLREADILRQLEHPHIVRFLDMNTANGQLWFAMDYVAGTDAGRLLKKHGPLPVPRAVGLVSQLLKALEYAHGKGFVHRDIKPGNLMVTKRNGREAAVLADFGLARVYQSSQLSGLTVTGAMGGTPMFMPPEQITHYRQAQPAADQYAAAMTLYNLLTGCYGFDMPEQFKQWITMILEDEPVPIRKRRADIPKGLADVIHKALRKETRERFADVRALRQALKKYLT